MDADELEQARQQIENNLIQIGQEMGMVDSRCISDFAGTSVSYEAPDGSNHYFDLAPVVPEGSVYMAELPS